MTLDELFLDAGVHIDRLIDAHGPETRSFTDDRRSTRRTIGAVAAGALVVAAVLGVMALATRRDHAAPAPSAAASVFDDDVSMVVFIRHGASPQQVDLVRQQLLRRGDVIDTGRIEYLDAAQSLALARRVVADAAAFAEIEPRLPTMFRLHTTSVATPAQLADLRTALLSMPNVFDVRTRDSPSGVAFPIDSPGASSPTPTLAPVSTP